MAGIADREGVVAGFGRLVILRVLGAGPDLCLELMANFSSGGTEGERMNCGKIFQCRILGTVCYQRKVSCVMLEFHDADQQKAIQ